MSAPVKQRGLTAEQASASVCVTVPSRSGTRVVEVERATHSSSSMFGGLFYCRLAGGDSVFAFADEIRVEVACVGSADDV